MQAEVIEEAFVLTPNKDHQNFTETSETIKKGTRVTGKQTLVQGLRRGQPFTYKLFLTDNQKFIYLNKIQPMTTTEVTLGADSKQSATVVNIPAKKKFFDKNTIIGSLVGAGVGFAFAKKKGYDKKKTLMVTAGFAVGGYLIGWYIENRNPINIKPSK